MVNIQERVMMARVRQPTDVMHDIINLCLYQVLVPSEVS